MDETTIPLDAPQWLLQHIDAERAVAAGWAHPSELISVFPAEGKQYNHVVGASPTDWVHWVRLPRQGPVPKKRHNRASTPGDGETLDTVEYMSPQQRKRPQAA
ncbi:hypothetical protein [Kitasatospora sp. NPDC088351]|uniref:hypothetical protein n=1 Tax=unclassified Kitasatospora TaxID=2633591 RepID=UPI003446A441